MPAQWNALLEEQPNSLTVSPFLEVESPATGEISIRTVVRRNRRDEKIMVQEKQGPEEHCKQRSTTGHIYRLNWAQTVLSQPAGMPTSEGALRDSCAHSQPSKKARTSSPPRLVDRRLVSGPSVEVRGGDGASPVTEPGGGRTGTL